MGSIFNLTTKSELSIKSKKILCIDNFLRNQESNSSIDLNLLFNRFKELNLKYEYKNIKDINSFNEKYYYDTILFLKGLPFYKEEIELIEKLKPKYIIWIMDNGYSIGYNEFELYQLEIPGEIKIPYTCFSTKVERYFLYNIAKFLNIEGSILEIGAFTGGTTIALGLGNRKNKYKSKIYSVDINFQRDYDYFLEKANVINDVVKIQKDSKLFAKVADKKLTNGLKILWIDGNHEYNGVKFDIKTFKKYLVNGGVILLHDYGREDSHHSGIMRAVYEEIINDSNFTNFAVIDSIFYAEKIGKEKFLNFRSHYQIPNSPLNVYNWLSQKKFLEKSKILIYGGGNHTKDLLNIIRNNDYKLYNSIIGIVDDNLLNGFIFDKKIYSIEKIYNLTYDYILISTYDFEEIIKRKLINNKKIYNKKIIPIYTNEDFKKQIILNSSMIPLINKFSDIEFLFKEKKESC